MDYGRSFTYMFKQPDVWKKILIGGLLLLVPVIGWLWVGGYTLRTLRSVMTGSENLPEWTRWGDLATQGIYVWLGGLIYGLPAPSWEDWERPARSSQGCGASS